MTPDLAEKLLREIAKNSDIEAGHAAADKILCELLVSLGYPEVAKAFDDLERWYA